MSGEKSIHSGHRQRLREQFLQHGLDTMAEVNALELLLFYAIPRQDTSPIAHRLLDTFGSLHGVMNAPHSELVERGGLSENAAALIRLVPAMERRRRISALASEQRLMTIEDCGEYLLPFFMGQEQEQVRLLCLDGSCTVLGCEKISDGTVSGAVLTPRSVLEAALRKKAVTVVLAHNHPSGSLQPSDEDIQATNAARTALESVGIVLADHLIIGDGRFSSMAEMGLL